MSTKSNFKVLPWTKYAYWHSKYGEHDGRESEVAIYEKRNQLNDISVDKIIEDRVELHFKSLMKICSVCVCICVNP